MEGGIGPLSLEEWGSCENRDSASDTKPYYLLIESHIAGGCCKKVPEPL